RTDVVGRLAPFAATPIQDREVDAIPEQEVPRVKVAVHPREPMGALAQLPSPADQIALELLAVFRWQERIRMGIAVENAHHTLAMPHQLADPPLVQRRLLSLVGVTLREELPQDPGPLRVPGLERTRQEAVEVEPVQLTGRFLDELEEFRGIGRRHQLTGFACERDVDTPHVARKTVVRRVSI